jgi:ABC-type bacteriocin/lantibiotic exporter with double-glycine peptidase domain
MNAPTEEGWPGKNALMVNKGEIMAKDITFAYKKSDDILQGFNLHIRPGEKIALCGKSGCGKTTFAYMLLGFYEAQNGSISIDGQSLSDCTLKSIRQNIGMISQDILLFDGSIRENLLLGKPGASDDEIVSALQKAGIWEHISGLTDGINTVIGHNGIGLSGGQKQRIAIARIYLKNPSIIIFDEATSSLRFLFINQCWS